MPAVALLELTDAAADLGRIGHGRAMIIRLRAASAAPLPLLLCACGWQRYQNMLGGAAIENGQFQGLFSIFLGVCGVMYVLVIGFLLAATLRRHRQPNNDGKQPLLRAGLIGWSALIGVGLSALAVASFVTDRSMAEAAAHSGLSITITANQWWWEISYDTADPSKVVHTANELHLPAGIPARIRLRSNDVIHSLWIPSLAGKADLIPGRETVLNVTPQRTGLFRGQCAEFCGLQHAKMALVVSVDSPGDFATWLEGQRQPARVPASPLALAGFRYVTTRQCSLCHAIAGTTAQARTGPDLTHFASRRSIAAGTLPMARGSLYGWVANPQTLKPGAKMPAIGIEPGDLHAVVAYLETLK